MSTENPNVSNSIQTPAPPNQPTTQGITAVETELALAVNAAGDHPNLDSHAKELLSFKSVVAMILKHCAREFSDASLEIIVDNCLTHPPVASPQTGGLLNGNDRVTLLQQEHFNSNEAKSDFDNYFVAFDLRDPTMRIPIRIDIEPQNVSDPGYPLIKRAMVYCGAMLTDELVRKEASKDGKAAAAETDATAKDAPVKNIWDAYDYNQVHKVYSIWVCTNPKAADRNSIVQYQLVRKNTFGNCTDEPQDVYDLCEVVLINLGTGAPNEASSNSDLIDFLTMLFKSAMPIEDKKLILQNRYKISMSDEFQQEVEKMSGIAQGIAEWAAAEATTKATDTANKETAKRLIQLQRLTADEIASSTTLDKQTVLDLAKELNITLPAAS